MNEEAPVNTTAGIEGPKLKIGHVTRKVIKAAVGKSKKEVAEEHHIIADVLFCEEDGTAISLS
jgi:hypothetical protein